MIDGAERDDKITAVAEHDMSVAHISDISELPDHFSKELRNFLEAIRSSRTRLLKLRSSKVQRLPKRSFSKSSRITKAW